jgi:Icc-related predicted phosphoesterase
VLAGDIHLGAHGIKWAARRLAGTPVLYVAGNHEYYRQAYPSLLPKLRQAAEGTNVFVLENDGVNVGGVRFLGCTLWTDFRLNGDARMNGAIVHQVMSDFRQIRMSPAYRRFRPEDAGRIHHESRKWLESVLAVGTGEPTVVVSHHAPSAKSLVPGRITDTVSSAFASDLEELIEQTQPVLWIHGHTHHPVDYRIGRTRVLSNPRGYPDEGATAGFDSGLVVEVG